MYDSAARLDEGLRESGAELRMVKIWRTMKDERVRPNHRVKTKHGWKTYVGGKADHQMMEGVTVLADEQFTLSDGSMADCPGKSGVASQDINCRCFVQYKLMSDEEFFQATGRHFAIDKSAESGIIQVRGMSNNLRSSPFRILTDEEIRDIRKDAATINVPESVLRFNEGDSTGFIDSKKLIYIRGDIFPDTSSNYNRDLMSPRAVLAHEYYGHYLNYPSKFEPADWRDEFKASYDAALNAPNLTDAERASLMVDAFDRAREAGVPVKHNAKARRIIYGYE